MRAASLVLLGLLACASARSPERSEPARLRVVSLHDVTTDLVVELGATALLVGVMEPVDPAPEVAAAITQVPRVASLESILAVAPSVVLTYGVVAAREPALVAGLRRAGVRVEVHDPHDLTAVLATTRALAHMLGREAEGEALAARLSRALAPEPIAAMPRRVFVFDCCDPPFTAGGRTVLTELIARAGGRNIFAEVDADWTHVAWEQVLARQPELVIIHRYGADDGAKARLLEPYPTLRALPRVELPLRAALAGPRAVEGLGVLKRALSEEAL